MKAVNHWKLRNALKNDNIQFNTLFKSVMSGTQAFENVDSGHILSNKELNLVMTSLNHQECIMCNSGNTVSLESAILWPDEKLIEEKIFLIVINKITELYEKIKECLKNILSKAPDLIKAFCEKIKHNKVIAALIKRFNLSSKINSKTFLNSYKITDITGDEFIHKKQNNDKHIFYEYTKLSASEASITDIDELLEILSKWKKGANGELKIMSRRGHILSKGVCMAKCILIMERINSIRPSTIDSIDELCNIDGIVQIDKKKITSKFIEIGNEITSNKSIQNSYDKISINESNIFKTILHKTFNLFKCIYKKIKIIFSKKNSLMKSLLWLVMIVLTALSLYSLMKLNIFPILVNIYENGGINKDFGTFKIVCANKSFIVTVRENDKKEEHTI